VQVEQDVPELVYLNLYRPASNDIGWSRIRQCCEALGIDTNFAHGSRKREHAWGRQAIMAAIKVVRPKMSFPDIGRRCGVDHTTVMHAIKKVNGCKKRQALRDRCVAILSGLDANA